MPAGCEARGRKKPRGLRFRLNAVLPIGILSFVTRFTKYVAMLTLALWGLATLHCDLEQVPGFEFLVSCHPQNAPHQDNDCDNDGCSAVESGFYQLEKQPPAVSAPLLVLSFVLPLWEVATPRPAPHLALERLNGSPPELPRVWQFSSRTALPPRAPSCVA